MSGAQSTFQREEVEAALRSPDFTNRPDPRGVAIATETAARIVSEFDSKIVDWNTFRDEVTVVIVPKSIIEVATFLRDVAGFALLSDISPCDWLDRLHGPTGYIGAEASGGKRFSVNYHFTKLVPGAPRIRIQLWVDVKDTVPSLIEVFPTADWHEREAFDFYGIEFTGREGLRRLIMPEDWVGHPLRKDYPIGGEPAKFTNSLREEWVD